MTTFDLTLATDDTVRLTLPDGRIATVWCHSCPACTSLDVHTSRGCEVEPISAATGNTTAAPMGLMPWRNGARPKVDAEPAEGSHGWPAVSGVTVVWHDGPAEIA